MARSLVAAVVLMLGCGAVTLVPSDRYTVTAPLMLGPGKQQPLAACWGMNLSLPPSYCGGVEVRGVNAQEVPGARRLSNGVTMTDTVRLVGWWDGTGLNLTEPPRRATPSSISTTHVAAEATPRAATALRRALADEQELKRLGISVLQWSTDGDSLVLLVLVADQRTVWTLEQRYGPVLVSAWLQRA